MPDQPRHPPHAPAGDCREVPPGMAEVRLASQLSGTGLAPGETVQLSARSPHARWEAISAHALIHGLAAPIQRLRHAGPRALLVGVLPYSGPATALVFADQQPPAPAVDNAFTLTSPFRADWGAAGYEAGVRRVLGYLAAGDAYQVNLAQRFSAAYEGNPKSLYDHLIRNGAPPHAAWLDLGHEQILCLSPESFLEVAGGKVVTRPIKGTRPRSADPLADARAREHLQAAQKDRAENLMIVDLLRNDLGKVCRTGTVRVPALFALESFRHVHHLVSTIEGELQDGAGIPELLAACFPGGSITGAPKRRAMEIIAELEPHPREIYCGSIFWMTADGRFGSNIAIRTLLARNGQLYCWGGAGIVADSDPAAEQQECLDKVGPIMRECEKAFLSQ